MLAAVESVGVSRERFLTEAGLEAAQLEDASGRIPLADYSRVVAAVFSTTGDPAFGLHMGERMSSRAFDVLGHLAEHSSNLREAVQLSVRYASIVTEGPRLELEEQGDVATFRLTRLIGEAPEVRLTAEIATSGLLLLIRMFVGADVHARRVCFAYEPPAHRAEYTRIFGGREQFSHAFTGIELDRAWLDHKQLRRSPELHELLQARAEVLLAKVDQDAPAGERLKRWLTAQSLELRPTMTAAARGLEMSARSLRRHLQSEGVVFDELVDRALAFRAKQLLGDPRRSVQEIAYAMGFATPAAFSRAFKRWTGVAPSAYRAAH